MNLSPNFTLEEMTRSTTAARLGIRNVPSASAEENLRALCVLVLEPVRAAVVERGLGAVVRVNSGYRCDELNKSIGGSRFSDHMCASARAAADIEVPGLDNASLAAVIVELGLPFRQLILEFYDPDVAGSGWVHVGHEREGDNPRDLLTATRQGGKVVYLPGIHAPGSGA